MSVVRPYRQTVRQFIDGEYAEGGRARFIQHPRYADRPDHHVRSFLLLQEDIKELFEYVEPAERNLRTYSLRILGLLIRTCVEIEANFKEIFRVNTYERAATGKSLSIEKDYYRINRSHFLDRYRIKIPYWTGDGGERHPFGAWAGGSYNPLRWYQAYNKSKHDRIHAFEEASFGNLTDAWCGLAVVLTSQYLFEDFAPGHTLLATMSNTDPGFEPAIGSYLSVALPADVPLEDRYEFDWTQLRGEPDPFVRFDYDIE